ncbi:hypothetical protein ACR3K2_08620 [Cryptosporidium serpentis]
MQKTSTFYQCKVDNNLFFYSYTDGKVPTLNLYRIHDINTEAEEVNLTFLKSCNIDNKVYKNYRYDLSEQRTFKKTSFNQNFSWSPNNYTGIFSYGINDTIQLINCSNNNITVLDNLQNEKCCCLSLDWNPDKLNSHLAIFCNSSLNNPDDNGLVVIYDIQEKQQIQKIYSLNNTSYSNGMGGIPKSASWLNSTCFISGWQILDSANSLIVYDIRTNNSYASFSNVIETNCIEYISVNPLDSNYILASDNTHLVEVYDIRSIKKNQKFSNKLEGHKINKASYASMTLKSGLMNSLEWFPYKQLTLSLLTGSDMYIISTSKVSFSAAPNFNFDDNLNYKNNFDIVTDKNSISGFFLIGKRPISVDKFCWLQKPTKKSIKSARLKTYDSLLPSLAVVKDKKCSVIPNFFSLINVLGSDIQLNYSASLLNNGAYYKKTRAQINKILTFGFGLITQRLKKLYGLSTILNDTSRLNSILSHWSNVLDLEAKEIILSFESSNSKSFYLNGIFPILIEDIWDAINIMRSASHLQKYLDMIPLQITASMKAMRNIKDSNVEDKFYPILAPLISPHNSGLVHWPSIRDEIIKLNQENINEEELPSLYIEFNHFSYMNSDKLHNSNGYNENYLDISDMRNLSIEIYSSKKREQLIILCGVKGFDDISLDSIDLDTEITIKNSYILSIFWKCITLQYQHFLHFPALLSKILNRSSMQEFGNVKSSFIYDINVLFTSAGFILAEVHRPNKETNYVDSDELRKRIAFFRSSILSTSEKLLNDGMYKQIWSTDSYIEAILTFTINFLVVLVKYFDNCKLYESIDFPPFANYLMENLLLPNVNLSIPYYTPSYCLVGVGLYYLPIGLLLSLVDQIAQVSTSKGLLDAIIITGVSTPLTLNLEICADMGSEKSKTFFEKKSENTANLYHPAEYERHHIFRDSPDPSEIKSESSESRLCVHPRRLNGHGNSDFQIGNLQVSNFSAEFTEMILRRYLYLTGGDIQTISLIGVHLTHFIDKSSTESYIRRIANILSSCYNKYRNLLQSNGIISNILCNIKISSSSCKNKTILIKNEAITQAISILNILNVNYISRFNIYCNKVNVPTGNILFCYYCGNSLIGTSPDFGKNKISNQVTLSDHSDIDDSIQSKKYTQDTIINRANRNNITVCNNIKSTISKRKLIDDSLTTGNTTQNTSNLSLCDYTSNISTSVGNFPLSITCPNKSCGKPLPRCVVCLTEISLSNSFSIDATCNSELKSVPSSFNEWYTWCLHCHHGGCFKHINEWFEYFDECPVSECHCWCTAIDSWSRT